MYEKGMVLSDFYPTTWDHMQLLSAAKRQCKSVQIVIPERGPTAICPGPDIRLSWLETLLPFADRSDRILYSMTLEEARSFISTLGKRFNSFGAQCLFSLSFDDVCLARAMQIDLFTVPSPNPPNGWHAAEWERNPSKFGAYVLSRPTKWLHVYKKAFAGYL